MPTIKLEDVKQWNAYQYYRDTDPTTADNDTAGFTTGERWLNVNTGASYKLSDATAGTWIQIEQQQDFRIDKNVRADSYQLYRQCGNYFLILRDAIPNRTTAEVNEEHLAVWRTYVSALGRWELSAKNKETRMRFLDYQDGDFDGWGDDEDLEIRGSRRNDQLYNILEIDGDTIVIRRELFEGDDTFLVAPLKDLAQFVYAGSRLVWYDNYIRPSRTGFQSERIGTYSYQLGGPEAYIGGLSYPGDVAGRFVEFVQAAPGYTGRAIG